MGSLVSERAIGVVISEWEWTGQPSTSVAPSPRAFLPKPGGHYQQLVCHPHLGTLGVGGDEARESRGAWGSRVGFRSPRGPSFLPKCRVSPSFCPRGRRGGACSSGLSSEPESTAWLRGSSRLSVPPGPLYCCGSLSSPPRSGLRGACAVRLNFSPHSSAQQLSQN